MAGRPAIRSRSRPQASSCLFAGPSLFREAPPAAVSRYGPVALGSVFRAVEAGYQRVGIVDGVFGNMPSVWHKEILFAISEGVEVAGAASMGALRAAELRGLGMVGLGRIYRLFRSGAWTDDDEVAVLHAPEELEFRPLSDAMANIRFTLRKLRHERLISRDIELDLIERMKSLHFSERTADELRRQGVEALGRSEADRLVRAYKREYIDVKRNDARTLMQYLARPRPDHSRQPRRLFRATWHWRGQFERQIADVPHLR
jgi:hypothetical protein